MRPFVLNLLLFCAAHALAQTGDTGRAPIKDAGQQLIKKKCGIVRIPLPLDKRAPLYAPLFDSIRVLDFRRDTSRIGLISSGRKTQEEVLFHTPAADQLGRYLYAGYSSPKGGQSLLVVIKNLWISDPVGFVYNYSQWRISFRFEAYLQQKDGYIPLTYLDTTVRRATGSGFSNMAAHELPELIDIFMAKVAEREEVGNWAEKRTVSYEQIDSFNRTRFDYAMDTVTRPVKGVYVNVEEFKNNAPSVSQYELSKDKSGNMELRVPDGSGQLVYTHTVWGFCDGKQTYVMMDGNLFPVFCVQHQFYVLGSKEYHDKKLWIPIFIPVSPVAGIYGSADISENVVRTLHLFRLDVKTGHVIE
jgi:hypothetical protein